MPEKINSDDFDKFLFKGRGTISAVFKQAISLSVGEGIKINRAEWKKRYSVSRIINYIRKKYGYQFSGGRLADGSGWAYRREK